MGNLDEEYMMDLEEFKEEFIQALHSLKSKGLIKDFTANERGGSITFPEDMYTDDRTKHLSKIPNFITH